MTVTAKHTSCGLLGNNVAGNFHEVGLGDFALVVVEPQIEQLDGHLGVFRGCNAVFVQIIGSLASREQGVELETQLVFFHEVVEFGDASDVFLSGHNDAAWADAFLPAKRKFRHDKVESGLTVDAHALLVVDGLGTVQRKTRPQLICERVIFQVLLVKQIISSVGFNNH